MFNENKEIFLQHIFERIKSIESRDHVICIETQTRTHYMFKTVLKDNFN